MSHPTTRGDRKSSAPGVVLAWHEALIGGDLVRLVELSHPDVEVGGPRGGGRGAQLLGDWVLRSGIRLFPMRPFNRAETVVVDQEAEWRTAAQGETSDRQAVASVFVVRDGLVASVLRYPDLAEALPAAKLDGSHEVTVDHLAREGTREEFGKP